VFYVFFRTKNAPAGGKARKKRGTADRGKRCMEEREVGGMLKKDRLGFWARQLGGKKKKDGYSGKKGKNRLERAGEKAAKNRGEPWDKEPETPPGLQRKKF